MFTKPSNGTTPKTSSTMTVSVALRMIVLSSLVGLTVAERCSTIIVRRRFELHNAHATCIPLRRHLSGIMTRACKGSCHSYSQPLSDDPSTLHRSCNCCEAVATRKRRIPMRCENIRSGNYDRVVVRVSLPTSCMCRPCDVLPESIQPAEFLNS